MSRCECCDHPLEHAIREALARDAAPIPAAYRTPRVIFANLQQALDDWRDGVVGASPSPQETQP